MRHVLKYSVSNGYMQDIVTSAEGKAGRDKLDL